MTYTATALRRNLTERPILAREAIELDSFDYEQGYADKGRSQQARNGFSGLDISFRTLSKSFSGRDVLQNISLDIPAGQFVAIVGRSGGGKTTLMRLIAGLDTPTSGQVYLGGAPAIGLQKQVRLLFQDARLLPWQTVLGNVGVVRNKGWRETARAALDHVGLEGRENDWPAVLSGGQRQRVALARALVSQPGVLLLDEPYGALDALTRRDMHELTEHVWQENRFTSILITHDVSEAIALADRVLVLREGEIALDVTVDLPRPRHGDAHLEALLKLRSEIIKKV